MLQGTCYIPVDLFISYCRFLIDMWDPESSESEGVYISSLDPLAVDSQSEALPLKGGSLSERENFLVESHP